MLRYWNVKFTGFLAFIIVKRSYHSELEDIFGAFSLHKWHHHTNLEMLSLKVYTRCTVVATSPKLNWQTSSAFKILAAMDIWKIVIIIRNPYYKRKHFWPTLSKQCGKYINCEKLFSFFNRFFLALEAQVLEWDCLQYTLLLNHNEPRALIIL